LITPPAVDGRRVESFVGELRRYAPHYVPDLNLSDEQSAAVALMRIFAQLAETVAARLDQAPQKNFVAFLDQLGITLLPARSARAAVTFRLASGLNEAVRVPAGTRVTAAGEDDDIPFETQSELVAIPGILRAAYGVDPLKDEIYEKPVSFLDQKPRTPTELNYTIQSFVAEGSTRFQLDHTTELVPDSFIRIGCVEKAVVQKVEEGFITLYKPVEHNFPTGTRVLPIRDFEVFNGIDIQEHVLYLGHDGIFTVKEAVELRLLVELRERSPEDLEALDLVWQFWTEDESVTPAVELWKDLALVADGTGGLVSSGEIILSKPANFEIKPVKVGGRESHWIRAFLKEKLPIGPRVLPDVETIKVGVNTLKNDKGEPIGIFADQGFHNATPLDVQVNAAVGFFPFGTEPRQFDQFYIASEEAFSKRKAQVSLNFELDLQTLAGPTVVGSNLGLRAYSVGLRRRLFELDVTNAKFNNLGNPDTPGTAFLPLAGSAPAAATDNADGIFVFVNTQDTLTPQEPTSKIFVNFHRSNQAVGTWTNLEAPDAQKRLTFSPAAVRAPNGFPRVFIVGEDGKLYSREFSPVGVWLDHGSPPGGLNEPPYKLGSSPFAVVLGSVIHVFVTGEGVVHWLPLDTSSLTGTWKSLIPRDEFIATYRPFAQPFIEAATAHAKVFVFGFTDPNDLSTGHLFECDTRSEDATDKDFEWQDLGQPTNAPVDDTGFDAHSPTGFLETPEADETDEGKHIFLRAADNRLYERVDGAATGGTEWIDHTRPGDPDLRDSPALLATAASDFTTRIEVLSASGRNSLVRTAFESTRVTVFDVEDARNRGLLLDPSLASRTDREYDGGNIQIVSSGGSESAKVDVYDGHHALARLTKRLSDLPDPSETTIRVGGRDVGPPLAGADRILAIHEPVTADGLVADAIYLRLDLDFEEADFYSRLTGMVSFDSTAIGGQNISINVYSALSGNRTEFDSRGEDTSTVPELSWEYFNGRGWLSIKGLTDSTLNLLKNGNVDFKVPKDIAQTEVAGQENFWIRARLVGGDYGRETFKIEGQPPNQRLVPEKSSLRPPKVRELKIAYLAEPVAPEICLTFNNLDYLDQTAAAITDNSHFQPFVRLDEESLTVFFGFDKAFKTGPVRLLLDCAERNFEDSKPPEFRWSFRKDRLWKNLDVEQDGSVALMRQGILTVSASEELTREIRFGESLFWIKGSLRTDRLSEAEYPRPLLRGIFPNTVWAIQGETVTDEIVGSGDGEQNQIHNLQRADVLEGEEIRVEEPLSVEERERIEREDGKEAVKDREDIGGTWVRWKETEALFDCGPQDRCYEIDRAAGQLRFGDGDHGRIPPAGVDNIRAFSYRTGGGAKGNVAANKIEALATAVAGIESVFNPVAAGGGSDKADTNTMLTLGPREISHRDRAVSVEDFEELAVEASRQVAKARCLRATNLVRSGVGKPDPCDPTQFHEAMTQRGFVSLIIVPVSEDPQPCPSLELRRVVKDYLRDRAPSAVAAGDRIVVRPPDYVIVSIHARILVTTLEKAAVVETAARTRLEEFLHPVTGGPEGTGWDFGRPVSKSDVFAVLERIDDIDRVEDLSFSFRARTKVDEVEIGPNELIASGQHDLKIEKG